MDERKTVHNNSSALLSNNKTYDPYTITSDMSQLQDNPNFLSYERADPFKNVTEAMSSLSVHKTRPNTRSYPSRFSLHPSYPYQQSVHSTSEYLPQPMNQPDAQAQLVAFTQPLMSVQVPYGEYSAYEQNYYSPRSYGQYYSNEQSSLPMKYKSDTTAPTQPEYYVDSYASNFSDKPSSNSNNKSKQKHVTFQEPHTINESPTTNSSPIDYPLSPTHMYPPSHPSHQHFNLYNPPLYNQFYTQYPNPMIKPRMMTHPVWPSPTYGFDPRIRHVHRRFPTKQLYDPNKPKVRPTYEYHNRSSIIRPTEPRQKKKINSPNNTKDSTVPISESIPHPITILKKPSIDTEDVTSSISTSLTLVENSSVPSSENEITVPSPDEKPSDILTDESLKDTSSSSSQSASNTNILFSTHELLSISLSANCLAALNEYAQQKKFIINYDYSSVQPSSFICTVSIDSRSFPPSIPCLSKNEAQKLACDQVLRILYRESSNNEPSTLKISHKHDYIAYRSMSMFQELNVSDLLLGRKTLACMIMTTDGQYDQARVISIATGNSCLDETNLAYTDDGTALHDCHAEILARRGLIRFLFEQIKQSKDNKSSIFQYNSVNNKFDLHENITFHMYISSIPCGNASLNIPSNSIRCKQSQNEGTILGSTSSSKYPIKSCSDKIYRWNIFGIQGGLLINFLTKPIYLESITLSCETIFDRQHIKYSLCERFNQHLQSLPCPYLCNLIDIDCPTMKTFKQERQVAKLQTSAFAWNITRPDKMELLEPIIGKLKNDRSMSLLSKRNLFEDFTKFIKTNFSDDNYFSYTTYQQAKQLDKAYITVKDLISKVFQSGSSDTDVPWLSKSDQFEQFSME